VKGGRFAEEIVLSSCREGRKTASFKDEETFAKASRRSRLASSSGVLEGRHDHRR